MQKLTVFSTIDCFSRYFEMSSQKRKTSSGSSTKSTQSHTKKELSNYHKRQMLIMLRQSHCHPKELDRMIGRFKVDETKIKGNRWNPFRLLLQFVDVHWWYFISNLFILDFFNEQAESTQTRIEQSFQAQHNKHFMNLNECAQNVLEHNECATDNTLPVTLEAIANSEQHPSPDHVDGVNLQVLYQFLANITAGYPIDDIENGPTKEFLKQCFTVMID